MISFSWAWKNYWLDERAKLIPQVEVSTCGAFARVRQKPGDLEDR
jgi:hypothetical protein